MSIEMIEEEAFNQGTQIKVIGVGGGGGNAVEHMITTSVGGVEFICANTDAQALSRSSAHKTIQLGGTGLGAGSKPDKGREAAVQAEADIRQAIEGAHMLFITAGMGGGTGTGAAPVIAKVAKEMGILTVGVVTKPFDFEGGRRMSNADAGLTELEANVDSLIVVLNEKLLEVLGDDVSQDEAFAHANDVLKNAVGGIAEIINVPGHVNVDFEDVRTVMGEPGKAMMGTAVASGPDRARIAAEQAVAYRARIQACVPEGVDFTPLMTLYLTDNTPPEEIRRAKDAGVVALKLYPAGATTNSDAGVTDIRKTHATLEMMQREGLLLLVHGEVTSPDIDLFDREAVFIEQQLIPLRRDFPGLKIVMEHITTLEAAQYVAGGDAHLGATITAHHLLYNRNAIFTGGIRPHYYCLPVLKRETHRQALVKAATSGSPKFFLGTDSAPHPAQLKEHATGCAGCYTAHAAMPMYAEAFDNAGALDKLEGFASFHGADFYGLPRNTGTLTLRKESWTPPESFAFGEADLKPLRSGEALPWRVV